MSVCLVDGAADALWRAQQHLLAEFVRGRLRLEPAQPILRGVEWAPPVAAVASEVDRVWLEACAESPKLFDGSATVLVAVESDCLCVSSVP